MKLAHKNGDCSYNIDGNTFDEYAVLTDDGVELCTVRFQYDESDKGRFSTVLQNTAPHEAVRIPGACGEQHVIASVIMTVLKHFTEDHSFYCESFSDEDGNDIQHPFALLPL